MAEVYKALQLSVNRTVAIKVMAPQLLNADPQFLMRFRQEAWIVAALEHPYILPVIDFGEQRDVLYLVLRYVSGGTLRDILRKGPLAPPIVLRYMKEIGEALDYAHGLGFVHRDIKPGNVLLDAQRNPFVADFGLAKIVGGGSITQSGVGMIGTPHYMSPEQGLGRLVDGRSDLYALGVILYEMLTGRIPYDADSTVGIVMKHINAPVPSVVAANPELPVAVDEVLNCVMAKSAADRYRTAAEFTEALAKALGMPLYIQTFRGASEKSGRGVPTVVELSQQKAGLGHRLDDALEHLRRWAQQRWEAARERFLRLPQTRRQQVGLLGGVTGGVLALAAALLVWRAVASGSHLSPQTQTPTPSAVTPLPASATVAARPSTPTPSATFFPPTRTATATPSPTPTASATPTLLPPTLTPAAEEARRVVAATDRMTLVNVPAGNFLFGSADSDSHAKDDEKPQLSVYLDAYWIDRTEVTVAQFEAFVKAAAYLTDAERGCCSGDYAHVGGTVYVPTGGSFVFKAGWQLPNGPAGGEVVAQHPVVQVSWNDARAYCAWAGRRLPTEAEWDKAARGTDGRLYPWGDVFDGKLRLNLCDKNCWAAWRDPNYDDSFTRTGDVGVFPNGASPYGVLDMAGNVREWVQDFYSDNGYKGYPLKNPPGPESGIYHVARSGSWLDDVNGVRLEARSPLSADARDNITGFRCALDGTASP